MKTIRDIDVKNKNVLIRVDYNVPLKNGKITDDLRIRASFPTIEYLIEKGVLTPPEDGIGAEGCWMSVEK